MRSGGAGDAAVCHATEHGVPGGPGRTRSRSGGLFDGLLGRWQRECLARLAPRRALARLAASDPLYALAGERLVERALRRRGWRFLARRLETDRGEVDLLFVEHDTLVLVEVKTGRAGPRFRPGLRLGRDQIERLWQAAHGLAPRTARRVDLFEVLLDRKGRARLVHWPAIRAPIG